MVLISVNRTFSRFVRRFHLRAFEHTGTRSETHLFGDGTEFRSPSGTNPFPERFRPRKCEKKFAQIHVIEIQNSSIGTGPSRRVASRMRFVERQGKFLENSSDNRRTLTDNHPFRFTEYKLLRHNAVPCIRAESKIPPSHCRT